MAHENRAFRATGDVYVFRITSGVEGKGLGPLNAEVLSFKSNSEITKVADKRRGRRGQTMKAFATASSPTGTLTLYSVPTKILSMLWLGQVVSRQDAGGTVSSSDPEAVAVELDFWTPLAHANVSSVVVTDDADATTTYVEGTDYELEEKLGLIRPLEDGAITDGATIYVSYTYSAVTGERIEVSTETTVRARILLRGINDEDDSDVEWEAFSALLTPNSDFDLQGDDPATAEFSLEFETPDGKDYPIRVDFPTYASAS